MTAGELIEKLRVSVDKYGDDAEAVIQGEGHFYNIKMVQYSGGMAVEKGKGGGDDDDVIVHSSSKWAIIIPGEMWRP